MLNYPRLTSRSVLVPCAATLLVFLITPATAGAQGWTDMSGQSPGDDHHTSGLTGAGKKQVAGHTSTQVVVNLKAAAAQLSARSVSAAAIGRSCGNSGFPGEAGFTNVCGRQLPVTATSCVDLNIVDEEQFSFGPGGFTFTQAPPLTRVESLEKVLEDSPGTKLQEGSLSKAEETQIKSDMGLTNSQLYGSATDTGSGF